VEVGDGDGLAGHRPVQGQIDVVVKWAGHKRARTVGTGPEGWREPVAWLARLGLGRVHACREATGRYGEGVAEALAEAGHDVGIVNPARVRAFAQTRLGRDKTDRLDAELMCDFCRLIEPERWVPPTVAMRRLQQLAQGPEGFAE
jgi:transposase